MTSLLIEISRLNLPANHSVHWISSQEFPIFPSLKLFFLSLQCRAWLLLNMTHNSLERSSLFDVIHGHDVVITRMMSCQTWALEIICSMHKTLRWFRLTAIRTRQTLHFICFSVESYFNHWNSSFHLGQNLRFFTWVSYLRSVSLSGFLFRISNILNKLFWVDTPLTVTKWRVKRHAMIIGVTFG